MSENGKETLDQNSRLGVESKSNRVDRIFAALDGVKPREAVEILIAALAVTTLVGKDPNAPIEEIGRTVGEAFLLELRLRDQKLNSGVAH